MSLLVCCYASLAALFFQADFLWSGLPPIVAPPFVIIRELITNTTRSCVYSDVAAQRTIARRRGRRLYSPEKIVAIARGVDGACSDFVEASVSESHRAGKARGELTHVSAGRGLCESIKV